MPHWYTTVRIALGDLSSRLDARETVMGMEMMMGMGMVTEMVMVVMMISMEIKLAVMATAM